MPNNFRSDACFDRSTSMTTFGIYYIETVTSDHPLMTQLLASGRGICFPRIYLNEQRRTLRGLFTNAGSRPVELLKEIANILA